MQKVDEVLVDSIVYMDMFTPLARETRWWQVRGENVFQTIRPKGAKKQTWIVAKPQTEVSKAV